MRSLACLLIEDALQGLYSMRRRPSTLRNLLLQVMIDVEGKAKSRYAPKNSLHSGRKKVY
jgi:hypothetical protein